MPIIKSAKKRVKVARKATIRNAKTKRALKSALKAFTKSPSANTLNESMSKVDLAIKKHVIHKNKGARVKHQLAVVAKSANVKPVATKKISTVSTVKKTAKPVTKKATTAKAVSPKTAVKKAPVKRSAKKA